VRIALLTSTFPLNSDDQDQAYWIVDIIRGLRAANHDVAVFTQDRRGTQQDFPGIPVERFPWPLRPKRLAELRLWDPRDLWAAFRLVASGTSRLPNFLQRHNVDLCLVFWALPSGWYAYRAAAKLGIPYRIWALGSDINKYENTPVISGILRRVLQGAEIVFADSFELAERITSKFDAKCEFLATTRAVGRVAAPARNADTPYSFLYVGRLASVKGVDLLLNAAERLPHGSQLSVAGAGPWDELVRQAADRIGPEVRVLGRISDRDLAHELDACDCVVIPSRSETIPIVLSEALQFGKRLIVTDVGDMGYIVRQYRLGEVVPAEDVEALQLAMTRAAAGEQTPDYDPQGWREASLLFDFDAVVERLSGPVGALQNRT